MDCTKCLFVWVLRRIKVFLLSNGDSSQIHASCTYPVHYPDCASPIIPNSKGEKPLQPVLKTLVCRSWGSNPRSSPHEPSRWLQQNVTKHNGITEFNCLIHQILPKTKVETTECYEMIYKLI